MTATVVPTPYVRALLECARTLPGFEGRLDARAQVLLELSQLKPRWLEMMLVKACFNAYDTDLVPDLDRSRVHEQICHQLQQLLVMHLKYRAEQAGRSRQHRAQYSADLAAALPAFASSIQPIYEVALAAANNYGTASARWHAGECMSAQVKGWYWSTYPGQWVWYCPNRNQVRGVDFADTGWHDLLGGQYWGPFAEPVPLATTSSK